jgi:hypothetical protein
MDYDLNEMSTLIIAVECQTCFGKGIDSSQSYKMLNYFNTYEDLVHFSKCYDCNGTGTKKIQKTLKELERILINIKVEEVVDG